MITEIKPMQQLKFEKKKEVELNKTLNCREILRVQKQTEKTKEKNNRPTMQKEREKESLLTCVCII